MSYVDLESLIKEIYNCKNNPEKSSTTKIGKHILCAYSSIFIICHQCQPYGHLIIKNSLYSIKV